MFAFVCHRFKISLALFLLVVLTAGVLVVGQPVASQGVEENTDSSWSVRCNEKDSTVCEIFQRLILKDTGQRVAEFAIGFPEGKDIARGVVILPLGILLPEGAQMQIDDGQAFKFKLRYCAQQGCLAFLDLNKPLLDKLRKGDNAIVTFKNLEGKSMSVNIPLSGFTKALKEIS